MFDVYCYIYEVNRVSNGGPIILNAYRIAASNRTHISRLSLCAFKGASWVWVRVIITHPWQATEHTTLFCLGCKASVAMAAASSKMQKGQQQGNMGSISFALPPP